MALLWTTVIYQIALTLLEILKMDQEVQKTPKF